MRTSLLVANVEGVEEEGKGLARRRRWSSANSRGEPQLYVEFEPRPRRLSEWREDFEPNFGKRETFFFFFQFGEKRNGLTASLRRCAVSAQFWRRDPPWKERTEQRKNEKNVDREGWFETLKKSAGVLWTLRLFGAALLR